MSWNRPKRQEWGRQKRTWSIYALDDPATWTTQYIGITCQQPEKRLRAHVRCGYPPNMAAWVRRLARVRRQPRIRVLETIVATYDDACARELVWIRAALKEGCDLVNHEWRR